MRILIVEDDAALASFIRKGLEAEYHAVDVAVEGNHGRSMALEFDYDLVVLDLNLPGVDGLSVLKSLRQRKANLPVMILTARSRVEDRVACLDAGADDFLVKPFSYLELAARARALLRRSHVPSESVLTVRDLCLDRVERKVARAGRPIELTTKEFALLEYLMRNAGRRLTRAMIIEHVWNLNFDSTTNVVDVYINYLRIYAVVNPYRARSRLSNEPRGHAGMSAAANSLPQAAPGPDVLGLLLHSVSQPLTSLRCSLEMELENSEKSSFRETAKRRQETVVKALQQTENVIGMIQLMREYLDAENPGPEIGWAALSPILRRIVDDFESIAAVRGIELMIVGDASARLPMSEAHLRKGLQYLIASAIDAHAPGGEITLHLEENATETVLAIKGEEPQAGRREFLPEIPTLGKVRLAIASRVFEAAGESLAIGGRAGDYVLRIPRRASSLVR